eukprot:3478513-Rhodomonas_salina.1
MVLPGCRAVEAYSGYPPAMLLRTCYAMSGTEIAYANTQLLRDVRVCCYALATRCPVLSSGMLRPGVLRHAKKVLTAAAKNGGSITLLCVCYAMSGTALAYAATHLLRDVRY